jgi:apurinic endonuclease APN1
MSINSSKILQRYKNNRSIYGVYNHNLYLNNRNKIFSQYGKGVKIKKINISKQIKDNEFFKTYIGRHINIGNNIYQNLYKYITTPLKISHLDIQTIKYPNTIQFFLGSSISYSGKNISKYMTKKDIEKINNLIKQKNIKLFIHSTYLSQLTKINKIIPITVFNELRSIKLLGGIGVIIHLGSVNITEYSSKGKIKKKLSNKKAENNCVNNVVNIIKMYINKFPNDNNPPKLFLETPSGKGGEICYKIEDLSRIFIKIRKKLPKKYKNMVQICLDTCHIFSAGYDIRNYNNAIKTILKIDKFIGFKNIGIIHLNDSAYEFNSRMDCHVRIGCGFIGNKNYNGNLDGFRMIILIAKKFSIPIILETPSKISCNGDDVSNILLNNDVSNELILINTIDILESKKMIDNDLKKISINNDNDIYYSLINYC